MVQLTNIQALVQIMAWRRPGGKPLFEPMMVRFLTHICVTWIQWFKVSEMSAIISLVKGLYQAITVINANLLPVRFLDVY